MSVIAVIPARYGSTRFPGKPLHEIAGVAMVERVRRLAAAAPSVSRVLVATDDARIANAVAGFGGEAVMTPESCRNGTERVYEAVKAFAGPEDVIVNLQGDAPLTPPWVIEAAAGAMAADPSLQLATPAVALDETALALLRAAKAAGEVGGTSVVFDHAMNALYFSKAIIPFRRETDAARIYKHIGLYAYRFAALERLVGLEPGPLELAESLEQLRALENGMPIRVVLTDYRGRTPCSVDSPRDAEVAAQIIAAEGELV
ncbi:3-deoxy-manno-octulosonate cytidylyltransferase [Alkalicaulis satelles]|uniref:3-deoxy-manno-octulosonate cytidylyltransferase n=1 Tax=Alkalicaulis satelles TaxID=2609175 RepID=A0A5M6ZFU1_9PROT|nr:3-deoxy-manno-octulosonate cytidylyltransferase [Alkalicaulis satelles]KAA5803622.1 3-deoxy-manno-octulosonate cytidylyltransferase [Alkalicaulis satelles]